MQDPSGYFRALVEETTRSGGVDAEGINKALGFDVQQAVERS